MLKLDQEIFFSFCLPFFLRDWVVKFSLDTEFGDGVAVGEAFDICNLLHGGKLLGSKW